MFTIVMRLGSRSSVARSIPRVRQATSTASSTTCAPNARHCQVLSRVAANVRYMSRWRVSTGRSVGSRGPPPSWWTMSSAPITRTKSWKSAELPGRRPRSMSVTNAGPPTAPKTRWRSPKTRFRSGLRAWSSKRDGADRMSSSVCAGSRRTRPAAPRPAASAPSRSTRAPARTKSSSAAAFRTSTPTSRRIWRPARWIASTWSALRSSSGANGLTIRRHGSNGTLPPVRRSRRGRLRRSSGLSGTGSRYGPARPRVRSRDGRAQLVGSPSPAWKRPSAPRPTKLNAWVTIGYRPSSGITNSTIAPWAGERSTA